MTKFRPVQIESICRQQNKCKPTTEILVGKSRKHCGKSRKCWLLAFSPFPTVFSTLLEDFPPFSSNLKLSSAKSFSLEESKYYFLGKG